MNFKTALWGFESRSVLRFSKFAGFRFMAGVSPHSERMSHVEFVLLFFLSLDFKYIYLLWTLSTMDHEIMHVNRMFALL